MTTLTRNLNTRAVRRLEKPRPLNRPTEAVESFTPPIEPNIGEGVMTLLDFVSSNISKENFDDVLVVNIGMLCKQLELYGAQLEASNKAQLDKAFYLFRDASRNNRLDHVARLNLLRLIELRDSHWQPGNNFTSFYTASFSPGALENATNELSLNSKASVPYPPLSPVLNPGEMIKASGKFPKPIKMPGKSYCKDEVVIRNADSGKVPSGAKERLVQITGPSEDNISHAIHLMDDTIRRNASPIREPVEKDQMGGSSSSLNSSASDESNRLANHISEKRLQSNSTNESSLDEFKYTVTVGNEVIRIVSSNFGLAMTAKLVLDEHFANASNPIDPPDYFSPCKSNSSVFVPGMNDVVPSISKNLSTENESLRSSGISLSNSSIIDPSFSSLSSPMSGIAYPDITGSLITSTLPSPPIAQPFSAYIDSNVINESMQIGTQAIFSNGSSMTSPVLPTDAANNVISSSPVFPIKSTEVNDARSKPFSLNQSLDALLSVTSTKKDEPKVKQYSRDALEALRSSNVCSVPPKNWSRIMEEFPFIIKPRGAITFSAPTTPTASIAPSGLFASVSLPSTPVTSNAPSTFCGSDISSVTSAVAASTIPASSPASRPPTLAATPLEGPEPPELRAPTGITGSLPKTAPGGLTSAAPDALPAARASSGSRASGDPGLSSPRGMSSSAVSKLTASGGVGALASSAPAPAPAPALTVPSTTRAPSTAVTLAPSSESPLAAQPVPVPRQPNATSAVGTTASGTSAGRSATIAPLVPCASGAASTLTPPPPAQTPTQPRGTITSATSSARVNDSNSLKVENPATVVGSTTAVSRTSAEPGSRAREPEKSTTLSKATP